MATFRFTVGPWNVHEGNETFGPGNRKSVPFDEKIKKFAEIGIDGIQFHDDEFHRRHMCLVRTKRAIAFAERLSEIEAYRPEKRFADAVKGLHLYGAKVVYPDELVLLDIGTELPEEEA